MAEFSVCKSGLVWFFTPKMSNQLPELDRPQLIELNWIGLVLYSLVA